MDLEQLEYETHLADQWQNDRMDRMDTRMDQLEGRLVTLEQGKGLPRWVLPASAGVLAGLEILQAANIVPGEFQVIVLVLVAALGGFIGRPLTKPKSIQ